MTLRDIVAEGITVVDVSRRNYNLQVRVGGDGDRGYLLKLARSAETRLSLEVEARAYSAFHEVAGYKAFRPGVPAFYGWDPAHGLLVLELLTHVKPVGQAMIEGLALPSQMGRILGSLHAAGSALAKDRDASAPWPLCLHEPSLASFRDLSPAHIELIRRLQRNPRLSRGLSELARSWAGETFIHGDVKWENWVWRPSDGERAERLALVDWEMMTTGEAAWDVGSVFAEILMDWVGAVQLPPGARARDYLDAVYAPLSSRWPATAAFWNAYSAARGWDNQASLVPLLRSARMAAGRLLQRTYETHVDSHELSGNGALVMDICDRLFAEPHVAVVHILGLSLSGAA